MHRAVGDHSAYSGFTYSGGGRTYSSGSGYYGHNYYNGLAYGDRTQAYAQGAAYGRRYYQGGAFYAQRQPGPCRDCRTRRDRNDLRNLPAKLDQWTGHYPE